MKEIKIDDRRIKDLIAYTNDSYFVGGLFRALADDVARDNGINIQLARIILALSAMERYEWIEMSNTRIAFYCDNKNADVYNITDQWIDRYEDGKRVEDISLEGYLRWSDYSNEVKA